MSAARMFSDHLGTLEKDLTLLLGCACGCFTGAKCEANTFDGERCLYGALSDAIRRLLKEYKQITAKCMKRDYYDVFLQRWGHEGCAEHPFILPELFCIFELSVQGSFERQLISTLSHSWACRASWGMFLCALRDDLQVCVCIASSELGADSRVNRKLVFIRQKH